MRAHLAERGSDMPYKIAVPGLMFEVEVTADSPSEIIALLEALRLPMPRVPSTPAPRQPKKTRGERAGTSARGQRLIPLWLEVFRMLAASQNGISSQEVSDRLGLATMNAIGRATVPIRKLLLERGLTSWEEAVVKVRGEDGAMWRAGPKIGQAIEIVETANRPG